VSDRLRPKGGKASYLPRTLSREYEKERLGNYGRGETGKADSLQNTGKITVHFHADRINGGAPSTEQTLRGLGY